MQSGNQLQPQGAPAPAPLTLPDVLAGEGLSAVLQDIPDPVLVLDLNKSLVFANQAALNLCGQGLRLGKPIICMAGEPWQKWLQRTLIHGEVFVRLPLTIKDAAGNSRTLSASLNPIRHHLQSPVGCLVVFREEKVDLRSFEAVQLKEATLASILDNFPTPFFMVDRESHRHPYQRAHGEAHGLLPGRSGGAHAPAEPCSTPKSAAPTTAC